MTIMMVMKTPMVAVTITTTMKLVVKMMMDKYESDLGESMEEI